MLTVHIECGAETVYLKHVFSRGRYHSHSEDQNHQPAQQTDNILPLVLKQTITPFWFANNKISLKAN
jgi:hypothetical protein